MNWKGRQGALPAALVAGLAAAGLVGCGASPSVKTVTVARTTTVVASGPKRQRRQAKRPSANRTPVRSQHAPRRVPPKSSAHSARPAAAATVTGKRPTSTSATTRSHPTVPPRRSLGSNGAALGVPISGIGARLIGTVVLEAHTVLMWRGSSPIVLSWYPKEQRILGLPGGRTGMPAGTYRRVTIRTRGRWTLELQRGS